MTTYTFTPETIRASAQAYNSAYPEAAEQIVNGTPVVRVHVIEADRRGDTYHVIVAPGIIAPEGGFIGMDDETRLTTIRRRDRRERIADTARRIVKVDAPGIEVVYQ